MGLHRNKNADLHPSSLDKPHFLEQTEKSWNDTHVYRMHFSWIRLDSFALQNLPGTSYYNSVYTMTSNFWDSYEWEG